MTCIYCHFSLSRTKLVIWIRARCIQWKLSKRVLRLLHLNLKLWFRLVTAGNAHRVVVIHFPWAHKRRGGTYYSYHVFKRNTLVAFAVLPLPPCSTHLSTNHIFNWLLCYYFYDQGRRRVSISIVFRSFWPLFKATALAATSVMGHYC